MNSLGHIKVKGNGEKSNTHRRLKTKETEKNSELIYLIILRGCMAE